MTKGLISLLVALVVSIGLTACEKKVSAPAGEAKRYELKGKVVEVDLTGKRVKVDHEKIEGFMDAMTMWFAVKDEASFGKLQVGEPLTATLIYNPNDNRSWLENLKTSR